MEKSDDAAAAAAASEIITGMKNKKKRVILVPYPCHSHTRAMFDLALILHSKGFSITIAHPKLNFPNPSDQPVEFAFVKLEDKSDGLDRSLGNQIELLRVVNESCVAPFEELLSQMMLEEDDDKKEEVACVVYDPIMSFAAEVAAKKLKVKTIAFWTIAAIYVHSCLVLNRLIEQKVFPVPESRQHDEIPDEYPLRISDVNQVGPEKEIPQAYVDFLGNYMDLASASAILWNTIEPLNRPLLEKIQKQHWQVPFFPIGPLHKLAPKFLPTEATTSASGQDHRKDEDARCLSWLDKQSPKAVIYVALGTIVSLDEKSLLDLAWGLARSEQPFLWSLRRSSLLNGGDAIQTLPVDFHEAIKDRGLIVEWVDQKRVLAHESIGCFLTHCGWHSVMECLSEGVPMLCWPSFGDQFINSRYITSFWKLGMELENNCDINGIERSVRTLMVGEESKETRQRVIEIKEKIDECIREGGLSYDSIHSLVDFINASSGTDHHDHVIREFVSESHANDH